MMNAEPPKYDAGVLTVMPLPSVAATAAVQIGARQAIPKAMRQQQP
jgi:hypothetical protein